MTTLNLVGLPIDLAALHRLAERRNLARSAIVDEGLVLHHLLGETFGPGAAQPFRLLAARGGRKAMLYAYAQADPAAMRKLAETVSSPEALAALHLAEFQNRPLPERLFAPGKILGFDILFRPVVRTRAGAERDSFQVKAEQAFPDRHGAMAAEGSTREVVYIDWLQDRFGNAAEILRDRTRLAHFQRRRVLRGGRAIEGPDAVLHGTLRVKDDARLLQFLAKGIGRHRAYGYGMLLLRPPQRC